MQGYISACFYLLAHAEVVGARTHYTPPPKQQLQPQGYYSAITFYVCSLDQYRQSGLHQFFFHFLKIFFCFFSLPCVLEDRSMINHVFDFGSSRKKTQSPDLVFHHFQVPKSSLKQSKNRDRRILKF